MRVLFAAALLLAPAARAAEAETYKRRACVKWSREIPETIAAGAGLFASTARVEGPGPFPSCDVVVETESFGVGWLMRAWMKQAVLSPCGEKLGSYKFRYKGEEWQGKIATGLAAFLEKHPKALAEAKACAPAPAVDVSTGTK